MRGWLVIPGLFLVACGTSTPEDPTLSGDGKDDGYDSSAAKKRENAVADKFEAARGNDSALRQLVAALPKGADLHMHLSGAAATETLIKIGAGDNDCVSSTYTAQACSIGGTPISTSSSSSLFHQILDAWSMEDNTGGTVTTRHDHFFSTFGKVGFITRVHTADMIADVRRTAAAENVQYLELMVGLGQGTGGDLAEAVMTPGGSWNSYAFSSARNKIISDPSFASTISRNRSLLDTWERDADTILGCGTSHADPGCDVTVRYLVQGIRIASREYVFGQFVYGFAMASQDPRVVGVNLVQAEDDPKSLANYHDQMVGIGWIAQDARSHGHPVNFSLHAGELTTQFASASDLSFHVKEAVEIAGANRIGHATDILGEDDSQSLLQEMAQDHVAVEACLTSNQQLLGVEGSKHPAEALQTAGVPVAFATDDQGILRIDMNDEIVRAFETQGLDYHQLKRAIRASMASTFLPGDRIATVSACKKSLYNESLSSTCKSELDNNEHAAAEWALEEALDDFEKSVAGSY